MSWWNKFLIKTDKKTGSESLPAETDIFNDSSIESNGQKVGEYDVDSIRNLLINGFTSKEILSLVQTLNNPTIIEAAKADKNKSHIVKVMLDLCAFDVLLENAKAINQKKFKKYAPYISSQKKDEDIPQNPTREKTNVTLSLVSKNTKAATEIDSNIGKVRLDAFKERDKAEHDRRVLRRKIKKELQALSILENCGIDQIFTLLHENKDNGDVLIDIWKEMKNSETFPIAIVGRVATNGLHKLSNKELSESLERAQLDWLKEKIAIPLVIKVSMEENGPNFQSVTKERIYEFIHGRLGRASPDFQIVGGSFEYSKAGDYEVGLIFSGGFTIYQNLKVELEYVSLPHDCEEALKDIEPLDVVVTKDVLQQIKEFLDDLSENLILDESKMSRALKTAYVWGYWKVPLIQDVLESWRNERVKKKERNNSIVKSKFIDRDRYINNLFRFNNNLDEGIPTLSYLVSEFRYKAMDLRDELLEVIDKEYYANVPLILDETSFIVDMKRISKLSSQDILKAITTLTGRYIDESIENTSKLDTVNKNVDNFTKYCLTKYYFLQGTKYFSEGEQKLSRPYFLMSLFFNSMTSGKTHDYLQEDYYASLAYYFSSYDINITLKNRSPFSSDEFYGIFFEVTQNLNNITSFGKCLLEISVVDIQFSTNLADRLLRTVENNKSRGKSIKALQDSKAKISLSLQEPKVFCMDPIRSIRMLDKLDTLAVGDVFLSVYNDENSKEIQNLVTSSFIKFISLSSTASSSYISRFINRANHQTKSNFAFLVFVQSANFAKTNKKNKDFTQIKVDLISDVIGLQPGTRERELIHKRITELSNLFSEYVQINDANQRGELIDEMQAVLESTKKWLDDYQYSVNTVTSLFLKYIENYIKDENAKLIRDTDLELTLKTQEVGFSASGNRIILEINNIGKGPAEWIELHVFPVTGQYDVAEDSRLVRIKNIEQKNFIQKYIYIIPKDDGLGAINLNVELVYSTLYQKNRRATLDHKNKTVKLVPRAQYRQIGDVYSISAPATTYFYGRDHLFDDMIGKLRYRSEFDGRVIDANNNHNNKEKDQSMIVYGIKRAGKTSVVTRFKDKILKERGLDQRYIPIYADVLANPKSASIQTDSDFLYFLIETIIDELPQSIVKELDVNLYAFRNDFEQDSRTTFLFLLDEILKTIRPMRLIVILDEFSTFYPKFKKLSQEMLGFLSNTIQSKTQLTFIFTGTYLLLEMMGEYAIDLAKTCSPILVTFLDPRPARQLIMEPLANAGGEIDSRVVDRIVDLTSCHPFLIQYLMMQLTQLSNRYLSKDINLIDFDDTVQKIISEPSLQFPLNIMWDEFDLFHKKVLSIVAALCTPTEPAVDVQKVVDVFNKHGDFLPIEKVFFICSNLEGAKLLLKKTSGANTSYEISIPLYKAWLQHNKPVASMFESEYTESP